MTTQITQVLDEQDIAAAAALGREIWTEYYTPIIGPAQVRYMLEKFQSEAAMRRQMEEGYEYYLIRSAGEPAGYFAVQLRPGGSLFLSKIYLLRGSRGRGLGREAFKFILERARQLGAGAVVLTVNKGNLDTIAAYEKWGFARTRPVVTDIGGGFFMDDWEYRFPLEASERG